MLPSVSIMFLGTKPPSPGVLWIWWRVFLMNLFIIHKNVMPNSTRDWVLTVEEKLGSTVYSLHGELGQVFITLESVKSRSSIYSLGDLNILTFPSSSFYHHCIHSLSQWDQSKPVDFSVSTEYKTSLSSYWLDLWPGVVPTSITASSSTTKILISSLLCCVTETSGLRWLSVLC